MADRSIAKLYIAMKGLPDDVKTEGLLIILIALNLDNHGLTTYTNWMKACRSGTHRACMIRVVKLTSTD